MPKDIKNFLNGLVYGTTLIIPGVSATLFAIILKFYDDLIRIVNHFGENYRKNVRYLSVFLLGIALGTVLFSSVIVYLLENFSFPTLLFFAGLLAGIVPLIAIKAKGTTPWLAPRKIALALIAMIVLFALSGTRSTTVNPAYAIGVMDLSVVLFLFLAGIINGATLVIPGLSGAFILLIMGLYPLVIYSVSHIGYFFLDIRNVSLLRDSAMVLVPFGVGALFGLLVTARIMEKLLRNFHDAVYAVILGLLLGSAILLLQDQIANRDDTPLLFLIVGAAAFCIGCVVSYLLGKKH